MLLHCEMKYNHLKLFGVLLFSKLCNFILVLKTSVNEGSNTPQSSSKEIFCNKALTSHKASRMQSKIKSKIKCHLMALLLRFNEKSLSIFWLRTKLAQGLHIVWGLIWISSTADWCLGSTTTTWILELELQTSLGEEHVHCPWMILQSFCVSASRIIIGYLTLIGTFWNGSTFV